jgi:phosphatidylserine/phosphatidylglycerophosphate/cardiolipin synthase-like enzyme
MAAAEVAVRRYGIETPYGSDPGMSSSLTRMTASLITGRRASLVKGKVDLLSKARKSMGKKGIVEGIFPAFNDEPLLADAMQGYYKQLLDSGVKVYEYTGKPMNHSKLEVADDVVVGGSSNMDARSWENDNENIFIIHDKALADKVWTRFEEDKHNAIEITPEILQQRDKGVAGLLCKWLDDFLRCKWVCELL